MSRQTTLGSRLRGNDDRLAEGGSRWCRLKVAGSRAILRRPRAGGDRAASVKRHWVPAFAGTTTDWQKAGAGGVVLRSLGPAQYWVVPAQAGTQRRPSNDTGFPPSRERRQICRRREP